MLACGLIKDRKGFMEKHGINEYEPGTIYLNEDEAKMEKNDKKEE